MTTIAWDGKTLAVDRGSWRDDGEVWTATTKLIELLLCGEARQRFGEPRLTSVAFAFTGALAELPLIVQWLRGDSPLFAPEKPNETRGMLMCCYSGRAFKLSGHMTVTPCTQAPAAEGGGHQMALGAMLAGAGAVRAIELVASRSGWAAGGVDSFTIGQDA